MIHPDDVAAWISQVRQQPEAAAGLIEALAARLIELDKQNESLRDELVHLSRSRESGPERERVATLARRVQTLERQLERGVQLPEDEIARSLLIFTFDGRGARVPLPHIDAWRRNQDPALVAGHLHPRLLLIASDKDELLLLSDKGRALRVNVADLDLTEAPLNYVSLIPGLALDLDESISVVISLRPTYDRLTMITRKGYARSFRRAEVDSLVERKLPLHSSPVEGDHPGFALLSDGNSEVLIATRTGKGVRFRERLVGVQSKPVINLDRGDVVAGAAMVDDDTSVVLVSADGVAVRREMAAFGAHPTVGNRGKVLTRIGDVIAAAAVSPKDVLWLLTFTGKLQAFPIARVPSGPGASRGKAIVKLSEDHLVAVAAGKGD